MDAKEVQGYEFLLARAKERLTAARMAYEQALRDREKVTLCVLKDSSSFQEISQLEAEITAALAEADAQEKPGATQLRMVTTRRALSSFFKVKAFAFIPFVISGPCTTEFFTL